MPVGEFTDLGAGHARHREACSALPAHLGAGLGQQVCQPPHLGTAHRHLVAQPAADEVGPGLVRQQSAAVQGDHMVGQRRGLARVPHRGQHGAAAGGEGPEEGVEPFGVLGREPDCGLVQQQRAGVAEQRLGQREPAVHAGREGAQPVPRRRGEPGLLQQLVGAAGRNPDGGGDHAQMRAGLATWMPGVTPWFAEQHADFALGTPDPPVGAPVEERDALPTLQSEGEPQQSGATRPLRSEHDGDLTLARVEGEVQHGRGTALAPALGQSDRLEHRASPRDAGAQPSSARCQHDRPT